MTRVYSPQRWAVIAILALVTLWVYVVAGNVTPRPSDHYVSPITAPRSFP